MDVLIVLAVALLASGLSLFSGFGLGTLLLPAFALVFPVPVAIAATAIVHLANNLFKLALLGRHANWAVAARFGIPAAIAAVFGAGALVGIAASGAVLEYSAIGRSWSVTPAQLVIGLLIVAFAILELSGRLETVAMPASLMPLGGAISGFFGGLSGIQGELRSAFLIKAGLDKHAFVATGVVAAVMVDTVRITIYGATFLSAGPETLGRDSVGLVGVACLAAFTGAFAGSRLLGKATLLGLHRVVALTMIAIGLALAAGIV